MQSPPASADATSVIILSLVFARPGASPRSRRCRTSSGRPRCRARVAGRSSPALATKRRSSKVIWIRSGWLRGSIYWVLLFRGRFFATKPLSQKHRSTFLPPQDANPTPSFGGFGLRLRAHLCLSRAEDAPAGRLYKSIRSQQGVAARGGGKDAPLGRPCPNAPLASTLRYASILAAEGAALAPARPYGPTGLAGRRLRPSGHIRLSRRRKTPQRGVSTKVSGHGKVLPLAAGIGMREGAQPEAMYFDGHLTMTFSLTKMPSAP